MFLGRVVRPGVDPQWLDTDRAYALAWQRNRRQVCAGCGTRPDEWDPAQGGDREAFVPDTHYCRGCELLAMQAEAVPKDDDGRPLPGRHHFLMPREQFEALHPDDD